mmetsp:Transcript_68177/g.209029  ORF Transcript_68177/g.209029 Transcript_68177/m.209029 type:complete len:352 (-) Transcript_68177:243-1298(-)
MVGDDLHRLLLPEHEADLLGLLVPQQPGLAQAALLPLIVPETVQFRALRVQLLLVLLACLDGLLHVQGNLRGPAGDVGHLLLGDVLLLILLRHRCCRGVASPHRRPSARRAEQAAAARDAEGVACSHARQGAEQAAAAAAGRRGAAEEAARGAEVQGHAGERVVRRGLLRTALLALRRALRRALRLILGGTRLPCRRRLLLRGILLRGCHGPLRVRAVVRIGRLPSATCVALARGLVGPRGILLLRGVEGLLERQGRLGISELEGKLLDRLLLVGVILGGPHPALVVALVGQQVAIRLYRDDIEVAHDLPGVLLAHDEADLRVALVLHELRVAEASLLPLAVLEAIKLSPM